MVVLGISLLSRSSSSSCSCSCSLPRRSFHPTLETECTDRPWLGRRDQGRWRGRGRGRKRRRRRTNRGHPSYRLWRCARSSGTVWQGDPRNLLSPDVVLPAFPRSTPMSGCPCFPLLIFSRSAPGSVFDDETQVAAGGVQRDGGGAASVGPGADWVTPAVVQFVRSVLVRRGR